MTAPLAALRARLAGARARLSRDKADTLLLLAGAALVLAPHAGHLPGWVTALCATTLAWRVVITVRGTRLPPALLLLPLAAAAMGGVLLTYHTLLGREAGVAMLVLLVAFKMLEMRARRDLFVLVYLCFFLLLTTFFYAQGIGTALLMAAAVVLLFAALLSFQFTGAVPPLRRRLWLAARTVAIAAPFALALFVAFPRIEGPLWGMPVDAAGSGRGATSGLSESMAPGNLSRLAQSDETAFRVRFLDAAPPQTQLYWRGVVLGRFDGRTWTRIGTPAQSVAEALARSGPVSVAAQGRAVRHQVTLEPSGQRWLFALDLPAALPRLAGNPSAISPELELSAALPITQAVRYGAVSHPDYRLQGEATLAGAARWLALPAGVNPRALADGAALGRLADPLARINAVLRRLHDEPFVYTLEPPLLGRDSVDQFLYQTRSGFCEHYASAFVFLMRAAAVPARVVTGYQGGTLDPDDGLLTVRQSDAHAWAEVWLAGRGWLRVDPTAAVAPERVRRSLARALPRRDPFGIPGLGELIEFDVAGNAWLRQVRLALNGLDQRWSEQVLHYTPAQGHGWLAALRAALPGQPLLAALAAGALLLLAMVRTRGAWRRGDPVDALYSSLSVHLGRHGLARASAEGPNAYRARLATSTLAPAHKHAASHFLLLYSAHKYGASQGANKHDANDDGAIHPGAQRRAAHLATTLATLLKQLR